MRNRISSIVILGLCILISFTACDTDLSKDERMEIEEVGILSVSEERPAEVVIGVVGSDKGHRCVNTEAKVYANLKGNTIRLTALMQVPTGIVDCARTSPEVYGEVTVSDLESGTYRVMQDDSELLHFHISDDAGYVYTGPKIDCIEVTFTDSSGAQLIDLPEDYADPVQVTIRVQGYFNSKCESYLKTYIHQDFWNDINVDISGDVPIVNTDCALVLNPYEGYKNSPYFAEIDLGTFPPGNYSVVVNGKRTWFRI